MRQPEMVGCERAQRVFMTGLKPSETAAWLGGRAAGMKLKEIKVIGTGNWLIGCAWAG